MHKDCNSLTVTYRGTSYSLINGNLSCPPTTSEYEMSNIYKALEREYLDILNECTRFKQQQIAELQEKIKGLQNETN